MTIKVPLLSDSASSLPSRPYPLLLLLRFLSAIHIFAAALFPSQHWLSHSASAELPFLIFLSGFTLVHSPLTLQRSSFTEPQLFYLRRFALLFPFHAIAVFFHAIFFSTSSHPIRRAVFTSLFLSPYLPSSLVFPIYDSPYVAPNLIPSLGLAYIIFPVITELIICIDTNNRLHLTYASVGLYALTAIQAAWTNNLPSSSNPRPAVLLDYILYIPYSTYIPAFLFGLIVAIYRSSTLRRSTSPSLIFRVFRFLCAFTVLVCVIFGTVPLYTHQSEHPFFAEWITTGMLLPFFAAVACTAASISDSTPCLENDSSSSLQFSFLRRMSHFGFTYYLTASLVYRSLASVLCSPRHGRRAQHALCLASVTHPPLPHLKGPAAGVFRSSSMAAFYEHRVSALIFVPVSMFVAVIVYFVFVAPLLSLLTTLINRMRSTVRHGSTNPSRFVKYISHAFFDNVPHQKPRRDLSRFQRAVRILIYYVAATTFAVVVFRLSVPLISPLSKQRNSVLCLLPRFPLNCHDSKFLAADVTQPISNKSSTTLWKIFSGILRACRWISMMSLPPMLCNVLGHILFPRAVWQNLPSITTILFSGNNRACVDDSEEVEVDAVSVTNSKINSNESMENCPRRPCEGVAVDFILFIRYVTRGDNRRLTLRNVRRALLILRESGIPAGTWQVEVVTDSALDLPDDVCALGAREIVVPQSYHPTNGAKYKARALNYAISASNAGERDWIVHLDEETTFDNDTIRAILFHCGREAYRTFVTRTQQWPCIGQGPILYGRWLSTDSDSQAEQSGYIGGNWMTTLADSVRVSDDCGRYRLQFESGEVWVGMHGSFVVVCNIVEQAVTFDHGAEGSIAEDAFFAMIARTKGVRYSWIDALMFEQSPFTFKDFVKQRSRWLIGGLLVVTCNRIPLWVRWVMGGLTFVWLSMPITYMIVVLAVLLGEGQGWDLYFGLFIPMLTTLSLWNYVFGFFVTFSGRKVGFIRFIVLLYVQVVLTPIFGVMEMMSVCYALWNFSTVSRKFHVVQKDIPTNVPSSEQEQTPYGSIDREQRLAQ